MPAQCNTRTAAGTINPMTFIQTGNMVTTAIPGVQGNELLALQCTGAGVEILGVAQEFANGPAGTPANAPQVWPAATIGQPVRVYGDGEEAIVVVGSGYQIIPDQLLTSDASGNAIPVGSPGAGKWIGARAIESANGVDPPWGAGYPIRVTVKLNPFSGN